MPVDVSCFRGRTTPFSLVLFVSLLPYSLPGSLTHDFPLLRFRSSPLRTPLRGFISPNFPADSPFRFAYYTGNPFDPIYSDSSPIVFALDIPLTDDFCLLLLAFPLFIFCLPYEGRVEGGVFLSGLLPLFSEVLEMYPPQIDDIFPKFSQERI